MRPVLDHSHCGRSRVRPRACGFGEQGLSVSEDDPNYNGAVLFADRCSGCHTLDAAGSQGTGNRAARTQGPNLDQRTETYEDALFAIQNGGFSGAIMPQNIVVGEEAQAGGPLRRRLRRPGRDRAATTRVPDADGRPSPADRAARVGRAMLDLKLIREQPERVREALARRGAADEIDELLRLDARRRELLPEIEGGRARQNAASEEIAAAKREGGDAEAAIAEMRDLSARIKALEAELAEVEGERDGLPPRCRISRTPRRPAG